MGILGASKQQWPHRNQALAILIADLKACSRAKNLERGKQLHVKALTSGHCSNGYVSSALINMYAKCKNMDSAREVFNNMDSPDAVSWTSLILGYADNGQGLSALELFSKMKSNGPAPDAVTFVAALKACSSLAEEGASKWLECKKRGKEIHELVIANGCACDNYVQSTLINMYSKCGCMVDAHQVFDMVKHPDMVSWNALILGYAEGGQGQLALNLFMRMKIEGPSPNYVTFLAALKACTLLGASERLEKGKEIHKLVVENGCDSNLFIQNALIDMYSKCGTMVDARKVFDGMKKMDVVSWTALILGYAENGQGLLALDVFTKMRAAGPPPNSVTYLAALKACGLVGGLDFGKRIHAEIEKYNHLDVVLVTCLVDFYVKCGSLVEARRVFDLHEKSRNIVTWTALLAGFSSCGDYVSVFGLFQSMKDEGYKPDAVTFLSILACCSHVGLFEKGNECFNDMCTKYGLIPTVEHYNCMVDLSGRAKKLDDAMALLQIMRCSPNDVSWMTVLGACLKWKNVEIGRLAFQSLTKRDAAAYVIMGHIYRSRGILQEEETILEMERHFRALEETCWTTEIGEVHTFFGSETVPLMSNTYFYKRL